MNRQDDDDDYRDSLARLWGEYDYRRRHPINYNLAWVWWTAGMVAFWITFGVACIVMGW